MNDEQMGGPSFPLSAVSSGSEAPEPTSMLFGDILSHDLMSPVWIAENYLRLIMDGGVPADKAALYEGLRSALTKARRILSDARMYLQVQDLVALKAERVDLGHVAEEVAQRFRLLGATKGQTLSVSCARGASIAASPLIEEAVGQLLANAVNYGPPNTTIEVVVSDGPRVRLEVRDRGPGVPPRDRERLFRRFEVADKGPVGGTGLGLAIVRRIVELHHGSIHVEENPGGGSVFAAEFPAVD